MPSSPTKPLKAVKYAPPPHAKRIAAMAQYAGIVRPPMATAAPAWATATGSGSGGGASAAAVPGLELPGGSASAGKSAPVYDRPSTTGSQSQASATVSAGQQIMSQTQRSQSSQAGQAPAPLVTPKINARSDHRADLSHSVMLGAGELWGIHSMARNASHKADEAARKQQLRDQSKARYQNWGNTLEALRERKQRERQERLAATEVEQQKIDEAEAAVQAESRAAAIDRAGRLLYQENDRVKEFHSALLLSSVLKERTAQIDLARVRKQHNARVDAMHFEAIKATVGRLKAAEEAEVVARKEKSKEFAVIQEKQLAAAHERRRQEALEEIRIGELNRKIAIEAAEEERAAVAARKKAQFEFNVEYLRMNEEQKQLKKENAKLESKEDAKIREYAAEKERTTAQRKAVEAARFKAKHDNYQKMLSEQYARLKEIKDTEQARIDRHAAELMKRTDERHAAETVKRNTSLADLKKTRARQRERALAERAERLAEENAMIAVWKQRAQEMADADKQRAAAARTLAVQNQSFLEQQIVDGAARRQAAKIDDLEFVRQRELQHAKEEAELQRYAESAIEDFANMQKATIPLKIALAGVKRNRDLRPTLS